ncbi:MAG: tetratricopeptide repeat protein, partial [Acidobacteria bacterium]
MNRSHATPPSAPVTRTGRPRRRRDRRARRARLLPLWLSLGVTATVLLAGVTAGVRAADPIPLTEAIATQQASVRAQPSAAGYNDLGNLLGLDGQIKAAEQAYRSALELEPDRLEAIYNLALVLQQRGRDGEAEKHFRRVLKLDPLNAWAHFQVGTLQQAKGNRKAAIRSIARAFELDPRLSFADVNPQVIGNEAATAALLVADVDVTASAVPRLYANPQKVVSLLTSDLTPAVAAPATGSGEGEGAEPPQTVLGVDEDAAPGSGSGSGSGSMNRVDGGADDERLLDLEGLESETEEYGEAGEAGSEWGEDAAASVREGDEASAEATDEQPRIRVLDASSLRGGGRATGADGGDASGGRQMDR